MQALDLIELLYDYFDVGSLCILYIYTVVICIINRSKVRLLSQPNSKKSD